MLSDDRRQALLLLKREGWSYAQIGHELGVSRQRVQQMIRPSADLRRAALERDGYKCQLCGATKAEVKLDVHHVHYTDDLADLVTWCTSCHSSRTSSKPRFKNTAAHWSKTA